MRKLYNSCDSGDKEYNDAPHVFGTHTPFLDRHQVWRSHDPMSVRNFPFCEIKKDFIPPFLLCFFFYKLSKVTRGYQRLPQVTTGYRYLPGYPPSHLPSYRHSFWCFPIWLTTTLSYPMAIFSANEIRTFLYWYFIYCDLYFIQHSF